MIRFFILFKNFDKLNEFNLLQSTKIGFWSLFTEYLLISNIKSIILILFIVVMFMLSICVCMCVCVCVCMLFIL